MKSLLLAFVVLATTQTFAAPVVELGTYSAVSLDKQVSAEITLKEGSKATAKISVPPAPEIACSGEYKVDGNLLKATKLDCGVLPIKEFSVDITNSTPDGLRSANGVEVKVKLTIPGVVDTEKPFMLKRKN